MPRGGIWAHDLRDSIIDRDRSSYRAECNAHAQREAAICIYESVVRRALIIVTGEHGLKYHRDHRNDNE